MRPSSGKSTFSGRLTVTARLPARTFRVSVIASSLSVLAVRLRGPSWSFAHAVRTCRPRARPGSGSGPVPGASPTEPLPAKARGYRASPPGGGPPGGAYDRPSGALAP
ncbi:hypothetical protein GCM10010497_13280 [Streptomyces cinereoruber]|uniref:Uncharacterized protein n=1 Tax=Streptomyces cinereoruber TaxID=67260 RepID=A0AAV4KCA4_9ACTN|nr:hypothetical protein GCM10010497_13280 [Streptomyces cinereoruber]